MEAANTLVDAMGRATGFSLKKFREDAEAMGGPALIPLARILKNSPNWEVRWEAAKALGHIADPTSCAALVAALEDENPDVGAVAANALDVFGDKAVRLMLKALVRRPASLGLRAGVRHVLRLRKKRDPRDRYPGVLEAIEKASTEEAAAVAACEVLSQSEPRRKPGSPKRRSYEKDDKK